MSSANQPDIEDISVTGASSNSNPTGTSTTPAQQKAICRIPLLHDGVSKGYGFAHFADLQYAYQAIDCNNGKVFHGKVLRLSLKETEKERDYRIVDSAYRNILKARGARAQQLQAEKPSRVPRAARRATGYPPSRNAQRHRSSPFRRNRSTTLHQYDNTLHRSRGSSTQFQSSSGMFSVVPAEFITTANLLQDLIPRDTENSSLRRDQHSMYFSLGMIKDGFTQMAFMHNSLPCYPAVSKRVEKLMGKVRWVRGTTTHTASSFVGDLVEYEQVHECLFADCDTMFEELLGLKDKWALGFTDLLANGIHLE
ncbi:hypothetical protein DL98DRAFT_585191 [Cadophora sp. DSE1049]|nr:hypothetical protein DL98DRAFT_585191 [Cadophora sp. DSE1049]